MRELRSKIKDVSLNRIYNNFRFNSFLLCVFMFLGCNPVTKFIGPFSSSSVEESRKRNAFLWKYRIVEISTVDTLDIEIQEAFSERMYYYYSASDLRYKVSDDDSQIVIIFMDKLSQNGHFNQWTVGDFYATSDKSLTKTYKKQLPPDTLTLKIFRVNINEKGRPGEDDGEEMGSIILMREHVSTEAGS